MHYDAGSKIITAMLELPGMKKSELSIKLSTCVYNHVRQVTVSGISKRALPEIGLAVRERKFGDFTRTLAVPPETTVRTEQLQFPSDYSDTSRTCFRRLRI